ncbi:MAG: hypothetical protein HY818_13560 [Acetobacterium woodii]|nr:hypothetical protein [Acetobacterium woodii]
MERQARVESATVIYHVMLKGQDGRNIFLDDADLSLLKNWVKPQKPAGFNCMAIV